MKYEGLITDLKNHLSSANKVLVVLPEDLNADKLAAGLALYLSLKESGKQVSIASSANLDSRFNNIVGVSDITNTFPQTGSGSLTLTLEGVVDEQGKIPLEKMDYFPEGRNLNLVFTVLPGQRFEPTNVIAQNSGGPNFDLIFVVGAANLLEIGNFYKQNLEKFADIRKVNIDNSSNNNLYGLVNIVDPNISLSEIMMQVLVGLGTPVNSNIATDIIAGIYDATGNLTHNITPETFLSVSQAMQAGGQIAQPPVNPVVNPVVNIQPAPQPVVNTPNPVINMYTEQPKAEEQAKTAPVFNNTQPNQSQAQSQPVEETPAGEYATTSSQETVTPTPDWLTPKIYKGGSLG